MCGIAGVIDFQSPFRSNLIEAMTSSLRHRGPDDEGYLAVNIQEEDLKVVSLRGTDSTVKNDLHVRDYFGEVNLYFGHRRLAILDLSEAGRQPMKYGDKLWITYNGEIYNYLELREELKIKGYQFNTGTDTEVILAAYDCWGENCVERFNGDWAFCILDLRRRILFLSRDRYGIKPLYYFRSNYSFAFASEIKAILSLPIVTQRPSQEMMHDYLAIFCIDHTKKTLWENIDQLLAGQNMRIDLRTGKTELWRYYVTSYSLELGEYSHQTAMTYASNIRGLLFDAIRLRLRADVSIGSCLSGGLDSSSVVAIMGKILAKDRPFRVPMTFTASYPGDSIDESRFARKVIERTRAISHFTFPSKEACWRQLPKLLHYYDEPFGGPAFYAQWEVMREASKYVKIVVDGQAGDEVFGGYGSHRASLFANLVSERRLITFAKELWSTARNTSSLRSAASEFKLVPYIALSNPLKSKVHRIRYGREMETVKRISGLNGATNLTHLDKLFGSNLNESLFNYMTMYSLPHLLKYEDRNSMAHSIEARVPFTDYRLVDYVFSLPSIYKIHNGWSKWLLRLAVQDLLPPEIVWRKDKLGFATPGWTSRQEVWQVWMKRNFRAYQEKVEIAPPLENIS